MSAFECAKKVMPLNLNIEKAEKGELSVHKKIFSD